MDEQTQTREVPRPRRRRRLLLLLLALLAIPLLLLIAALGSLRVDSVRQAVLGRLSSYLAEEFKLAFAARDFEVGWGGRFEITGVRVGVPGAAPLVTAERVRGAVDLWTLRSPVLGVRYVEVHSPRLDLAAPIPEIPSSEPSAPPGFEIRWLTVRDGAVVGAPTEGELAQWVTAWRADGLGARGWFRDGVWDIEVRQGRATVERPGFAPLVAQLAGHLSYQDGEPVTFRDVRAEGDGLGLAASGSLGLDPGAPVSATFDATVEPRLLTAGTPPGGRIHARGDVRLPEAAGKVSLTAEAVPAEVARPYLEADLFRDLSLTGTVADVAADLTAGPGALTRIAGKAEAIWRRGQTPLARAEVKVRPDGEGPVLLDVYANLLPASAGRRHVQGTLRAESWEKLAEATAQPLVAEVRSADVAATIAQVRALWPRLVPPLPAGTPARGTLRADVRLTGPLPSPDATLAADWSPEPGSRLRVTGAGQPLTWTGRAEAVAERLPLSLASPFAPGLAGELSGQVRISGAPGAYRTDAALTAANAAYPPSLQRLESARIDARGTLGGKPLAWIGTVDVDGAGLFAARLFSEPTASGTARVESFQLLADGRLVPSPLAWKGRITLDGSGIDAAGLARASSLQAVADGTLGSSPLIWNGTLSLTGQDVESPGTARVDVLRAEVTGDLSGPSLTRLAGTARATVETPRLEILDAESGSTTVEGLKLDASVEGTELRIASLSGSLPENRAFNASGRATLSPLLAEADLDLSLVRPLDAIPAADLTASLRQGILTVLAPRVETASGPVRLDATVPLGALRGVPALADAIGALPFEPAPGLVAVSLDAPALDTAALLPSLGMEAGEERARAGLQASFTFDPAVPAAGSGEVRLTDLVVETPQGRAAAQGPVTARLADGRLELLPARLAVEGSGISGAGVDLRGGAELDAAWSPWSDPPAAVVRRLSADAGGTLEASLLQPFLQGGTGSGALTFAATLAGPLDGLTGSVRASGPDASFFWPTPYATRLEAPEVVVALRQGSWQIEEGRARLNGGTVNLSGGGSTDGGFALGAGLDDVRYRVDYGLSVLVDGQFSLVMPPEERALLSGRVVLDRGVLDRDVNLDREVLNALLAPDETPGTEASILDEIDLDVRVVTAEGVRIKNNVGDLRASWDTLFITGTAENPVIRGRIDLDPGGLLYAYGQTVRIDRGSLLFRGDPLTDPEIDVATTTSLQDPTIAQLRGSPLDLLEEVDERRRAMEAEASTAEGRQAELQQRLRQGTTSYFGARLFSAFGRSLGLSGIQVRPILEFQENDPSARLNVERALSPYVSFLLSVDLRNAERQTYLVDLHGFRDFPGLTLLGFTNDEGSSGANLQQVLELGGGEVSRSAAGPRLRRVRIEAPAEISGRRLKRAIGLERKAPVPPGSAFEVEVDLADALRRRGYPDPRVRAEVVPVEDRSGWVDVNVTVEPGPRVAFAFEGDKPPRVLREGITGLYRTDFYEPTSLDEMRDETAKAFRSQGHLDPRVEIAVERLQPDDPDGPRRVVIRSDAGPRAKLEELLFPGLPADAEIALARRFPGTLARAELAAGLPGADARLISALHTLGYAEPRIAGRKVERDGDRLTVTLEPGERQVFGTIEIEGAPAGEAARLDTIQILRPGDAARRDYAAESALLLERALRSHGFPDAAVRPVLTVAGNRVDLRFQVEPGARFQVAEVAFEGGGPSDRDYLEKVARLETGAPLSAAEIDEARGRLLGTGLFSRVTADVARDDDGEARVTFSLGDRPRYRVGYGVRYESEAGFSAVVDAVDTNFLGRGITFGARGLYEPDDQSGRLYLRTGGLLGTAISLESFLLARRAFEEDEFGTLIEDGREMALQLARPFGARTTGRVYARYRSTHVFEEEPFDPAFPIDLEIRRPFLGIQALFEGRDDPADPRTGRFASLDLSGSGSFLGSDFDFVRLYGQVQEYRGLPLAGWRLVWAQSLRMGLASAFSGQELLEEERFLAGGEYSVRGYDTETLGPREVLGGFVRHPGGEALLVINEELRFPLPWDLTGLVFFDAGQVWADRSDFGTDLAKGTGLGLRARTPVGLVRIDLGIPLDRRDGDPEYKLYFGFGNAF